MAPLPKFKVAKCTTLEERTSYKSHEWLTFCIYGKETCEEAFFWSLLYKLPWILGDNQFIKITWLGDLDHLDTSMSDVFEHVDTRYHSKLQSVRWVRPALSRYFDAYAKIDTEWLSAQTPKSQLDSYSVDDRSTVSGILFPHRYNSYLSLRELKFVYFVEKVSQGYGPSDLGCIISWYAVRC